MPIAPYFFWLSASHDLRLGMDGMLVALCDHTGSRDRANVSLIIIITIIIMIGRRRGNQEKSCK